MSLQLKYHENFSEGLKRLITKQCEKTLDILEDVDDEKNHHYAVHETRKAFKKVRACLRLIRDEIEYYKDENRWFRDQGRLISDIRDCTAHIEALDMLKEQYSSELYKNSFTKLRKCLLENREKFADEVFKDEDQLQNIRENLENKLDEIPDWQLKIESFNDIRPSIKRTYSRGVDGLHNSLDSGRVEDLHEWRKRVKYLRYQIDILNRLWPQFLEALEDELHDVTDLTGNLHDLHNLQEIVMELDNPFTDDEEKILFNTLAGKQQNYLKKHALLKGQKFYTDSPSEFCDKFEVYWQTHQKEVENELLPDTQYLEYS